MWYMCVILFIADTVVSDQSLQDNSADVVMFRTKAYAQRALLTHRYYFSFVLHLNVVFKRSHT